MKPQVLTSIQNPCVQKFQLFHSFPCWMASHWAMFYSSTTSLTFKKILPSCLKQQKNPLCQSFALYTVAHTKDLGLDKCIFMEVRVDIVLESCCKLVFRNRMTMATFSATEDAAFLTRPEIFSVNMLWFLVYVPHTHMHFILYPMVSYGCVHLGFLFLWMCPKASVEKASLENKSLLASSLQVSLLRVLWWVKQKNTDFIQFCNRTPINTAVRGNSSSLLGWMVKNGSHIWRWS